MAKAMLVIGLCMDHSDLLSFNALLYTASYAID